MIGHSGIWKGYFLNHRYNCATMVVRTGCTTSKWVWL